MVLVPVVAVGAVGVPVNDGDAIVDRSVIALVFAVILTVFAATVVFNVVMLFVADVILVSKVDTVDEFTPPILFTDGASAVPLKSPANFMTPFALVVASGADELVILAATNAVVAI